MKWLDRLERKMGKFYIPGLMKYLCLAMLGVFILDCLPLPRSASLLLYFSRSLILQGQVWRLITFIFLPPSGHMLWILLALYFYYFLGTALESRWGSRKFNLYYLIGVLGAVAGGFITGYTTNMYLNMSLLLAFAVLYPEMEFTLFFILPVKVKWIGLLDAALLIYQLIVQPWAYKAALVLSLLPFLLFFGKDCYLQGKLWIRHIRFLMTTRK